MNLNDFQNAINDYLSVFAYKPNGKRAEYYEVSNAQANARVRQLLKANATAWC